MRSYELLMVLDPRLPDEGAVELVDQYKDLIQSLGAAVTREESWGKRKLAYPINKVSDGRYVILNVETEGANPFPEVEQRLKQSDQILRYLTVRTDAGRLRIRGNAPPPADGNGDGEAATGTAAEAPATEAPAAAAQETSE